MVEDSIEVERKERESERKVVDDLVRERDILNKNLVKMVSATQAQADVLKIHENSKRNLEVEIASYRSATLATARTVKKLRAERDRYAGEAVEAVEKFAKAQSEVKAREVTAVQLQVCVASHHTPHIPISPTSDPTFDPTSDPASPHLQHKIVEGEAKMKQQQNLYEAVRSDRNLYSKNLIESQDEIAEMKRKFKIMTRQVSHATPPHHTPSPPICSPQAHDTRQIEQLKEEIQAKDQSLVKEHFEHMKVDKEKEVLRDQLASHTHSPIAHPTLLPLQVLRDQLADVQKRVGKGEAEEARFKAEVFTLNMIINEADAERLKQQKEYETVLSERDVLGTQLIKRNDELGGLYEKIKVQQSTLNAGQRAYAERVEDIQALHVDIAALRSELAVLKASVQNIDLLRHEALQLNREVLHERTKVRARCRRSHDASRDPRSHTPHPPYVHRCARSRRSSTSR